MDAEASILRELADRAAIADLVARYALGATEGDHEMVASCFDPEAELDFGAERPKGTEEIRRFFQRALEPDTDARRSMTTQNLGLDRQTGNTPIVGNLVITLDGDRARGEVTAIACHAGTRDGRNVTVMRGLRYSDEYVRGPDGWKILRRAHSVRWSNEIVSSS